MRRSLVLSVVVAVVLVVSDTHAQTFNVDFNQFPANLAAESLGISGVTFSPAPASTWFTVDSNDLGFASLGGTCLFQPNTVGTLDIAFSQAIANVSFSFAMNGFDGTEMLKAEAFNGSTPVGQVVQQASPAGRLGFVEGFMNLSPGTAFNIVRLSSPTGNLIAMDNLRADGVLVAIISQPRGMLQVAGSGGATDNYKIANRGSVPASVSLTQGQSFFTQSPTNFTIPPGGVQTVTLTGLAQGPGSFEASSIISVQGLAASSTVLVRLLSSVPPSGTVIPVPIVNRVDIVRDQDAFLPSGSVSFRNDGTSTIEAIALGDVPWLSPQGGLITIPPGQTRSVGFSVIRANRPDFSEFGLPFGSVFGTLRLSFLTDAATKTTFDGGAGASLVTVVDTAKPPSDDSAIPPLLPNELAFFLTGVGHVTGGGGVVFISDVTIGNAVDQFSIGNVSLFFTPRDGSTANAKKSAIPSLLPNQSVSLADVVKNVYDNDQTVGSMQIRASALANVSVAASIFNSNDPRGTFGTAIPVLRSDRSISSGQKLFLPGLIQDATHRTNFYLQETTGGTVSFRTDFLNANGSIIGSRNDAVSSFQMLQVVNPAPQGTVTAIITHTGGDGSLGGYATPLDAVSGDTWAVTDWNVAFGSSATGEVLIPIAGSVAGANETFFRTDVAGTNIGTGSATVRFTYRPSDAAEVVRSVSLSPNQSFVSEDIVRTFFNVNGDSLGYILVRPLSGSFTVTSRTYTTVPGTTATFGTAVPALPLASGLKLGDKKVIGGLDDSSFDTISGRTPATFRTNVGLVETSGAPVTVRITLLLADGRSLAGGPIASKDYAVGARQLLRINGITGNILGADRADYGDIRNFQLKFEVVGGSGRVAVTTSSTDNGTGDSILRVE